MRTHVLHLERHDDVISTRDKMAWGKTPRILLVLPAGSANFSRRVDLVLLQRYGQEMGAQLALVTDSSIVRTHARELGIPSFESIELAHKKPWRRPWRKKSKPGEESLARRLLIDKLQTDLYRSAGTKLWPVPLRLIPFLTGVLAVLALAFFFLPSARLVLPLAEQEQSLVMEVWANPDLLEPSLAGGIPAQQISVLVEGENETAASGMERTPDRPARGQVQFTNLTSEAVPIPAGTIVLTLDQPPARFRTLEEIELDEGTGSTATVAIEALQAGPQGNLAEGRIIAVEGTVGARAAVTNLEATSGGSDRTNPAPSDQDYDRLRTTVERELGERAKDELESLLQPGQIFLPATISRVEITSEEWTPEPGQPGERLQLRMQAMFEGWYVLEEDVYRVAGMALDANLPEGALAVNGSLHISDLAPRIEDQTVVLSGTDFPRWQIGAVRTVRAGLDAEEAARMVSGKQLEEAIEILSKNVNLRANPTIEIWPGWWQRLPFLPFRITVSDQ